jgi:hypothetical protein
MSAPTPSVRVTPTATKTDQGYRILHVNSLNTAVNFWEIEVTPQGVDGGEAIQTSTQFNNKWHTKRPRALLDAMGGKIKGQLCAGTRHEAEALINKEGTITEIYPDGSTYCYYGYWKSVKFDAFKEGEKPTAEIEIVETDWDPTASVEQGPIYTAAAGTAG